MKRSLTGWTPSRTSRRSVTRDVWNGVAWVEHTIPHVKRLRAHSTQRVARLSSALCQAQFGGGGVGSDVRAPTGWRRCFGQDAGVEMLYLSATRCSPRSSRLEVIAPGRRVVRHLRQASPVGHLALPPALTTRAVRRSLDTQGAPVPNIARGCPTGDSLHRAVEGDLVRAVERYASQIAIDTEAISEATRSVNPSDPASAESALSGGSCVVDDARSAPSHALLETMLALIEGLGPRGRLPAFHLPHADALRE